MMSPTNNAPSEEPTWAKYLGIEDDQLDVTEEGEFMLLIYIDGKPQYVSVPDIVNSNWELLD